MYSVENFLETEFFKIPKKIDNNADKNDRFWNAIEFLSKYIKKDPTV